VAITKENTYFKCQEYQEKVTQNKGKTFQLYKLWSAKKCVFF